MGIFLAYASEGWAMGPRLYSRVNPVKMDYWLCRLNAASEQTQKRRSQNFKKGAAMLKYVMHGESKNWGISISQTVFASPLLVRALWEVL